MTIIVVKGGPGSGFKGHAGRAGKVGGSSSSGGTGDGVMVGKGALDAVPIKPPNDSYPIPSERNGKIDNKLNQLIEENKKYYELGTDVSGKYSSVKEAIMKDPEVWDAIGKAGSERLSFFEAGLKNQKMPFVATGWRYGNVPSGGNSRNFAESRMEVGVSMMALTNGDATQDMFSAMFIAEKGAPIVWAAGINNPNRHGSDGEPLLMFAYSLTTNLSGVKKETGIVVKKGGPGSGHRGHVGRPGKVGGGQPEGAPGVPKNYAKRYANDPNVKQWLSINAKNNDMSESDYVSQANDNINRIMREAPNAVMIGMKPENAMNFLSEGTYRINAREELSGSVRNWYTDVRFTTENNIYGISEGVDPSQRPIYAAIMDPSTFNGSVNTLQKYGLIGMELKQENIEDRSNVVFGDSVTAMFPGSSAVKTEDVEFPDEPFIPRPHNAANIDAVPKRVTVRGETMEDPLRWKDWKDASNPYIEVHIFGGVKLKDVKKVWIPEASKTIKVGKGKQARYFDERIPGVPHPMYSDIIDTLNSFGIPFETYNPSGVKKEIRIVVKKGGPGSGHVGHKGRPGKVGGGQPDDTGIVDKDYFTSGNGVSIVAGIEQQDIRDGIVNDLIAYGVYKKDIEGLKITTGRPDQEYFKGWKVRPETYEKYGYGGESFAAGSVFDHNTGTIHVNPAIARLKAREPRYSPFYSDTLLHEIGHNATIFVMDEPSKSKLKSAFEKVTQKYNAMPDKFVDAFNYIRGFGLTEYSLSNEREFMADSYKFYKKYKVNVKRESNYWNYKMKLYQEETGVNIEELFQ